MWQKRLYKFLDNPFVLLAYVRTHFIYPQIADRESKDYDEYNFLDSQETIKQIIEEKQSLIRVGDGTFGYLNGHSIYFQNWYFRYNRSFARKLKEVLIQGQDEKILFCYPHTFVRKDRQTYKKEGIENEWQIWVATKVLMKRFLRKEKVYGDALCFHPRYNLGIDFPAIKKYLDTKHVIIITTNIERFKDIRLGMSTTLIEGPANDAWRAYERLEKEALETITTQGFKTEEVLFMISAAEAAKVMVYDLTKAGYTAWDTGQFFDLAAQEIAALQPTPQVP